MWEDSGRAQVLLARLNTLRAEIDEVRVWEDSGRAQGLLARLDTLRADIDEVSLNPPCML